MENIKIVQLLHYCNVNIQGAVVGLSARVHKSVRVGVPGLVKDPNWRRKETVHEAGGIGPDGQQPPARGESVKKSLTGMGGVGRSPTCTPQSPGAVQVLKERKVAANICCSLLLSLAVIMVMEEVTMDLMMAVYTTHNKLGILLFPWVLFLFGLNFNEISKSSLWYY